MADLGGLLTGALGGAGAGASVSIIIKAIDNFSSTFKKAEVGTQKVSKTAKISTASFAAYGAAIGMVATGMIELLKRGAAVQQAQQSFNVVFGESADILLNELKVASHGMISNFQLMQAASRAALLGIAEDTEALVSLMEIAHARAKIMGITTEQAFNDIVTGVGRNSRMILDNLGIIVKLADAYARYAEELGKTADQLTATEQKQALLNDVIKQSESTTIAMSAVHETLQSDLERTKASFEDWKDKMAVGFATFVQHQTAEANLARTARDYGVAVDDLRLKQDYYMIQLKTFANKVTDLQQRFQGVAEDARGALQAIESFSKVTFAGERQLALDIAKIETKIAEARFVGDERRVSALQEQLNELRLQQTLENARKREAQAQIQLDLERAEAVGYEAQQGKDYLGYLEEQKTQYINAIEKQKLINAEIAIWNDKMARIAKETHDSLADLGLSEEAIATLLPGVETWMEHMEKIADDAERARKAIEKVGGGGGGGGGVEDGVPIGGTYTSGAGITYKNVGGTLVKQDDFIMRPGQAAQPFNADDTIVGFKGKSPMGGVTIIVQGNLVNWDDAAEEVAKVLSRKLDSFVAY